MTVSSKQRLCFPNGPVKGWCKPFCIFFTTFTMVMLLLFMSTDLKKRQYLPLDSEIWDFEGSVQYSPDLVDIIRKDFIQPPTNLTVGVEMNFALTQPILQIFKNQTNGVSIEYGVDSNFSDADWLVQNLNWRNLKIQANPVEIELLRRDSHGASTSHSCVSMDITASHTLIQTRTNYPNGTLTAVPCFPLFSVMKAFNATTTDLLVFNDIRSPIEILKTLPNHDLVNVKVVALVTSRHSRGGVCCSDKTMTLMKSWGYSATFICPLETSVCHFTCTKVFCPFTLT